MSLQLTLKALSDPTRREILNMLKGGKRSAGEIAECFDVTAAAVKKYKGKIELYQRQRLHR